MIYSTSTWFTTFLSRHGFSYVNWIFFICLLFQFSFIPYFDRRRGSAQRCYLSVVTYERRRRRCCLSCFDHVPLSVAECSCANLITARLCITFVLCNEEAFLFITTLSRIFFCWNSSLYKSAVISPLPAHSSENFKTTFIPASLFLFSRVM